MQIRAPSGSDGVGKFFSRRRRRIAMAIVAIVAIVVALGSQLQPGTRTRTAAIVPKFNHIFIVMMENEGYGAIIGNSQAPYINSLAKANGLAMNYHGITHPSVNNYLASVSGQVYSSASPVINDECTPSATACSTNAKNIFDEVEASGRTARGYMETMPTPCYLFHSAGGAGGYVVRHNPLPYFNDIRTNSVRCNADDVPYTKLSSDLASASTTPNLVWITPNLCDDMHSRCAPSTAITNGDNWLKANLPPIFKSPAWTTQNSTLFLTWDEDTPDTAANSIVSIVVSSHGLTRPGTASSNFYNHYSMLKTIECSWGLAAMAVGDSAASPMRDMYSGATLQASSKSTPTPPTCRPLPTSSPTSTAGPTPTPPATAGSGGRTVLAAADASVRSTTPKTNYGSSTTLVVGVKPTRHTYLKFEVPSGVTVNRADLQVFAPSSGGGFSSHSASSSWTESGIDHSNAPAYGATYSTHGSISRGWQTLNVKGLVRAGTITIVLTSSSGGVFDSRETGSGTAPRLIINGGGAVTAAKSRTSSRR
jgi:phosphatidylinositol-3-phosphatase